MRHFLGVAVAAVLALGFLVSVARATQVQYRSPQQLGAESALVVRGEVAEVRGYWNTSKTKIFTRTRIHVTDSYKGATGATVDVIQLGGVVGHVRMTVHGALAWKPGEEVLVFLESAGGDAWQVAGFSQGKYRVERNERGEPFVRNVPGGAAVVGAPGAGGSGPAAATRAVPLDDFVDRALGRNGEGGSR
jgi:hypothetical protein